MFFKLISNLPFNPGLIAEVRFYSLRLRQETVVRRFGVYVLCLALLAQMVAVFYPAERSLAISPNHILNGATSKQSLLLAWDNNSGNVRAIYRKFGIERIHLEALGGEKPDTKIVSGSADWWSVGRLPLTNFGVSGQRWGERLINAEGNLVYQRPLKAWDQGRPTTYKAFSGVNKHGVRFWILQDCGNLTFEGPYLPAAAAAAPKLEIHKSLLGASRASPGETVRFRINYRNGEPDSIATHYKVVDELDKGFEFLDMPGLRSRSGNNLVISEGPAMPFSQYYQAATLTVKIRDDVPPGTLLCNQVVFNAKEGSARSGKDCVRVLAAGLTKPAPPPAGPLPSPVPPPTATAAEKPRLSLSKSVSNATKRLTDANGSTVSPGDELVFSLVTQNETAVDYPSFRGQDYFGDVLDYAEITNLPELQAQGVSLDSAKYLRWSGTIPARGLERKTVKVKLKSAIPATNRPSGASNDYDCVITNRYGNEVSLNVGCPLVKNIELATAQLPETGPGATLAAAFVVTSAAGYLFARSRLLNKELELVRKEYAAGGGA